ncbi:MAG: RluA family pseudouridine synthase [Clostridia bacterium]|nr:RluA family pseudouridine synthase [Clostridia bacterium]
MRLCVGAEWDGLCVRRILQAELHFSTKMIKYLKYRPNGICVNGQRCTVRKLLKKGDILELETDDPSPSPTLIPRELPLEILYEDENIVVPSKTADMPTHPSHGHREDTVANSLAFSYANGDTPFVFRHINRLYRNTRGLLLIARNKHSAGKLTRALQAGEIQKTYLAVLDGEMQPGAGRIDLPLHRTRESIIVREVCSPDAPDADASLTEYEVLAAENGHTLVCAHPVTGRTHQLRVHFAALGHPITGDDLYGTPSPLIGRHALHAFRLSFPHPASGERLTLTAPLPEDMKKLINASFSRCLPRLLENGNGELHEK